MLQQPLVCSENDVSNGTLYTPVIYFNNRLFFCENDSSESDGTLYTHVIYFSNLLFAAKMMVPAHKLEIWPGYVVRCQGIR